METEPIKNKGGRPKGIKDSAEMLRLFELYVKWAKNNPLKKMDFKGKDADQVYYLIDRPLTWWSFDAFLFNRGIMKRTEDYRLNKEGRYSEFAGVIRGISSVIRSKQVEGAMAGLLKENLVARLNGIKDQVDQGGDVSVKVTKIGFE